jgi:hypothetical protein
MDEKDLQKLISELQNGSDRQRRAASYKLGKSKNPAVVSILIRSYSDSDGSVRRNVSDGLRSIGSKEALDFLAYHNESNQNTMPSMDSKLIQCDRNGIVTIKPMPILVYAFGGIIGLFGIGAFTSGNILLGISVVTALIIIYLRLIISWTLFEFNPKSRIFKIESNSNSVAISYDDIAGFGVSTNKETGNFTDERIIVILKDGSEINIGVITDAKEKKRLEKASNLMKFLYESTGIVMNVDKDNLPLVEEN